MSRMHVQAKVVEVLFLYEAQAITITDIMNELPEGANVASVRAVMRKLIKSGEMDISVIVAGNSWRLNGLSKPDTSEKANPNAGKSLGLFEQVGERQDGTLVVRDEENRLYELKPL